MIFAMATLLLTLSPVPGITANVTPPVAAESPASVGSTSSNAEPLANSTGNTKDETRLISSTTSFSSEIDAQNSQSLSTIRLPEIQPTEPIGNIPVERLPTRRTWLLLSVAAHSAATFDAWTTRNAISGGAREADPLLRPFASSPGIYAAIQVGPVLCDLISHRMQRSQNRFLRRAWWVPQSASAGISLFSGIHNLGVASQ